MPIIEATDCDLAAEFEPRSPVYPTLVRLAVLVGLSSALWGVIIVGGWGLYSLIA